jgi:hypothetical protein
VSPESAANTQLEKTYETVAAPDGSVAAHAVVRRTLADLARATNLRVEDATLALNECGLLVRREGEGDTMTIAIAISQEMVEAVARERNVEQMGQSLVTSADVSSGSIPSNCWDPCAIAWARFFTSFTAGSSLDPEHLFASDELAVFWSPDHVVVRKRLLF